MTAHSPKRAFLARPTDPERWIRASDTPSTRGQDEGFYTARLTIDITPELRGRIKVAAFQRGVTVANMLRELLAREFPHPEGEPS